MQIILTIVKKDCENHHNVLEPKVMFQFTQFKNVFKLWIAPHAESKQVLSMVCGHCLGGHRKVQTK